jgi:hypothetical protein
MQRDKDSLKLAWKVEQGRPPAARPRIEAALSDGDSVELWISSKASFSSRTRPARSPFDLRFVLAPVSESGPPAWEGPDGFQGLRLNSKPSPTGYELSATIPLSSLEGLDWTPGSLIRFDAAATKSDGKGGFSKIFFNAQSDSAAEHPDEWGLAKLE